MPMRETKTTIAFVVIQSIETDTGERTTRVINSLPEQLARMLPAYLANLLPTATDMPPPEDFETKPDLPADVPRPQAKRPSFYPAGETHRQANEFEANTLAERGDVYQAECGCTVNEALEAQRQQRLWAREYRPPAAPMCTPSRKGSLSQFLDLFDAA